MFQNCMKTNKEKKSVSCRTESSAPPQDHHPNKPSSATTISPPQTKIVRAMAGVMMNSSRGRGRSAITPGSGGSEAMAMAARVSMMMLTHRICTTVRGISVPKTAPAKQITMAAKLMVSWNSTNRWMLR